MTRRWPCIAVAMLCCLLAVATSASAEEPTGFSEWPWGTSKDTMIKAFLLPACRYDERLDVFKEMKTLRCGTYRVGDIQIRDLFLDLGPEDSLSGYSMYFDQRWYPQMRRVVSEKFGPPGSTSTKEYTTGAGRTVSGEVLYWPWPSGTFARLQQLCTKITESCLSVTTNPLREWRQKEEATKNEQRKKGF